MCAKPSPVGHAPSNPDMPLRGGNLVRVTAEEQLRDRIERLSEDEARQALRALEVSLRGDPVRAFFDAAPLDDEPVSAEEDAAVAEARSEAECGAIVSLEQARRQLTIDRRLVGRADRASPSRPPPSGSADPRPSARRGRPGNW